MAETPLSLHIKSDALERRPGRGQIAARRGVVLAAARANAAEMARSILFPINERPKGKMTSLKI